MLYGYARVSINASDLGHQHARLKAAGCERIVSDGIGSATAGYPQLRKLLRVAAKDDIVVVPSVDRLSCDMADLLEIVRDLQKAGVGLRSLDEPLIDTTTASAELIFCMLEVFGKLYRLRFKERMESGRAEAMAKGVRFGRKKKLTVEQQQEAIKRRTVDKETLRAIGESYGVSQQVIMHLVREQSVAPRAITS